MTGNRLIRSLTNSRRRTARLLSSYVCLLGKPLKECRLQFDSEDDYSQASHDDSSGTDGSLTDVCDEAGEDKYLEKMSCLTAVGLIVLGMQNPSEARATPQQRA
jgi:hypothetical protein